MRDEAEVVEFGLRRTEAMTNLESLIITAIPLIIVLFGVWYTRRPEKPSEVIETPIAALVQMDIIDSNGDKVGVEQREV